MLRSSLALISVATILLLSACSAIEVENETKVSASPTIAGKLIVVYPNQGVSRSTNIPPKASNHENSIETININGREIRVASQVTPYSYASVVDYNNSGQIVLNYGFSEPSYIWAQGRPTNNMPQEGRATYTGGAYHVTMEPGATNIQWTRAKSTFNVDFGLKQLTGSIADQRDYVKTPFPTINFVGNIQGNTFSATSTQGNIQSSGYFYGDRAAAIGGTYQNNDGTISGSFGAGRR